VEHFSDVTDADGVGRDTAHVAVLSKFQAVLAQKRQRRRERDQQYLRERHKFNRNESRQQQLKRRGGWTNF
jgi:hypothetical protein